MWLEGRDEPVLPITAEERETVGTGSHAHSEPQIILTKNPSQCHSIQKL